MAFYQDHWVIASFSEIHLRFFCLEITIYRWYGILVHKSMFNFVCWEWMMTFLNKVEWTYYLEVCSLGAQCVTYLFLWEVYGLGYLAFIFPKGYNQEHTMQLNKVSSNIKEL